MIFETLTKIAVDGECLCGLLLLLHGHYLDAKQFGERDIGVDDRLVCVPQPATREGNFVLRVRENVETVTLWHIKKPIRITFLPSTAIQHSCSHAIHLCDDILQPKPSDIRICTLESPRSSFSSMRIIRDPCCSKGAYAHQKERNPAWNRESPHYSTSQTQTWKK
jgi:hypothetical protein